VANRDFYSELEITAEDSALLLLYVVCGIELMPELLTQ